MTGQKKHLEEKNKILSPEKLSGMMVLSQKGMFVTVLLLLLVVVCVYWCLFTVTMKKTVTKKVFFDGFIGLEEIYEYGVKPQNGNYSKEEMQYHLNQAWGFSEETEKFFLFSTVMARREYDRVAPILGVDVTVDGRVRGKVVLVQSLSSYDELYEYGYTNKSLGEIDVYPGEDFYYALSILSDNIDSQMEEKYMDSVFTVRSEKLSRLLYVPKDKGKNS